MSSSEGGLALRLEAVLEALIVRLVAMGGNTKDWLLLLPLAAYPLAVLHGAGRTLAARPPCGPQRRQ